MHYYAASSIIRKIRSISVSCGGSLLLFAYYQIFICLDFLFICNKKLSYTSRDFTALFLFSWLYSNKKSSVNRKDDIKGCKLYTQHFPRKFWLFSNNCLKSFQLKYPPHVNIRNLYPNTAWQNCNVKRQRHSLDITHI